MLESLIQTIAIAALPVIFAITLHEAAHGYAARHFGDPTAWQMGRISLNPLRHIDLVGTIIIPASILLFSGGTFLFGYAKPVPVDFGRLRNPKKDMLWVAAAGPGANLFMALCWALMLKLAWLMPGNDFTVPLSEMSKIGIIVNCVLMVLNSGAAAAARWRAYRSQPATPQSGLEICQDRALGLSHSVATFIHRRSRCRHEPAGDFRGAGH
jgi:Zn-dependent protease